MTFTKRWHDSHKDVWSAIIPPLLPTDKRVWLEVGSWEGLSATWTLDSLLNRPGDELHCVDIWSRPEIEQRFDENVAGRAVKHKASSIDFLAKDTRRYCGVYIDGSHDAPDVLADAVLAWTRLDLGGVMIFDDYLWEHPKDKPARVSPKSAIDGFLSSHVTRLQVLHKGWQVIVRKTRQ